MNYLEELNALPEDEIVIYPEINKRYHLSWASNRGMVWVLIAIQGDRGVMVTPKTKKMLNVRINDLRHTNRNIIEKKKRRIKNYKKT